MPNDLAPIDYALGLLQAGECVAIPTETVYGLAADASNPDALAKIFSLKNRPTQHPLIVHIGAADQLNQWAHSIPASAYQLAEAFWPGPLTLVLNKQAQVHHLVTGGQDTVALRCPQHPLTLALLKRFAGGLCAPSANRFGSLSPTCPAHVQANFGELTPFILDGGSCQVGIESTIVDLSQTTPTVLRPGMLSLEQLQSVLPNIAAQAKANSPRVPGQLASHYAPQTRVSLITSAQLRDLPATPRCSVLAWHSPAPPTHTHDWITLPADPERYAQQLYQQLHNADRQKNASIYIETPPQTPAWAGIWDRLHKMASFNILAIQQ